MNTERSVADEVIAASLGRVAGILERRPETGKATDRSVTVLTSGLRCRSEEGDWSLETDMPETLGGSGSGPTPGVLGRAALGSCLAIGYQMWAARLGVPIDTIRVEIEADSDLVAMFDSTGTARPGYDFVRYHVAIDSTAPEDDVLQVLDQGDLHSPYRDVFANPTPLERTATINGQLVE